MDDWFPDLPPGGGPKYIAIADAIEAAAHSGALQPGARLPTHRGLARRLALTVGTITRAYAEAERRGLVRGEVGRGTFVLDPAERSGAGGDPNPAPAGDATDGGRPKPLADRPPAETALWPHKRAGDEQGTPIDLRSDAPVTGFSDAEFASALRGYLDSGYFERMIAGQPAQLAQFAARALGRWHAEFAPVGRAAVLPTDGRGGAITAALRALVAPGSAVMVESLVDPAVLRAVALAGCRPVPVQIDEQGLIPESVELACWSRDARALVCTPTLQVPTTATMSEARRAAILDSAARFDVPIVEIEGAARLQDAVARPLAALAPDRVVLHASLSATLAPWLAVGYLAVPRDLAEPVSDALEAAGAAAPPLDLGLAASWIEDGFAAGLLSLQRTEARWRRRYAESVLAELPLDVRSGGFRIWARLRDAEPGTAQAIADRAVGKGALLGDGGDCDAHGGREIEALCLTLGTCGSPSRLRRALEIVVEAVNGA